MAQLTSRFALLLSFVLVASPALAADWEGGDATKGENIFKRCQACHTVEKGAAHRIGPNLHGIVNSKAAAKKGYRYSPAMQAKAAEGLIWTGEVLYTYLERPQAHVPRSPMSFVGLKKPDERRDLIAYLIEAGK